MGMIYGFVWIVLIFFYIIFYKKLKKDGVGFFKRVLVILVTSLPFTYDIAITNVLSGYYCLNEPNPNTQIIKKVEYPKSIYWEDNVYPGFSKGDRELMVINYLDGVHLKTMALNGDDGKIYVYEIDKNIYKDLKFDKSKYENIWSQYAHIVMQSEKVFTKQTMPKLNYTVTFNEIKLNDFSSKFLYSDETKVIDNKTDEIIAYNRRIMRFFYNLVPDIQGGNYYYSEPIYGKRIDMEQKLFDSYGWSTIHLGNHSRDLDEILIKRYIKGEK